MNLNKREREDRSNGTPRQLIASKKIKQQYTTPKKAATSKQQTTLTSFEQMPRKYTKWKALATYVYYAKDMALKDIDFVDETAMKKELISRFEDSLLQRVKNKSVLLPLERKYRFPSYYSMRRLPETPPSHN